MGWKEDLAQRKQRREAMKYFRSNNDQFLDVTSFIKLIVIGFLLAIAFAFIFVFFSLLTGMMISMILAFFGTLVGRVLKKNARNGNTTVGIIAVASYCFMIVLSSLLFLYLTNIMNDIRVPFMQFVFAPSSWLGAIKFLQREGIIGLLVYLYGAYWTYRYTSN